MFLEPPSDKPLMTFHSGVNIMAINAQLRLIEVVVHITCDESELHTRGLKKKVNAKIDGVKQYLVAEGFMNDLNWNVAAAVIGHPPKGF